MASLQQLKNRLSGSSIKSDTNISKPVSDFEFKKTSSTTIMEIEEARYLLALIAKSDFSGKDIQIVYNTALKLQEIIKEKLDKE